MEYVNADFELPLAVNQADVIVGELTRGRMRVIADATGVYLVHHASGDKLHLLDYQLTPEGLGQAVTEFWDSPVGDVRNSR